MKHCVLVFVLTVIKFVTSAREPQSSSDRHVWDKKVCRAKSDKTKKEDEAVLENKERERGRLTFWSTFDVSPNAD